MMILKALWIAFLTVLMTSCGATTPDENNDVVGLNGTLTQVSEAVSEEDCPNGGVTLEHGIDLNADGTLSADEVTHTYAICHGENGAPGETGPAGPAGSDADVSAVLVELDELRAELSELRAEVESNTAKVGISDEQAAAIEANTSANSAQDALIAENALRAGITPEQSLAIEQNTAKVGITLAQAAAIEANADALLNIGTNPAFDGWDKSVVDDAEFITTETDPVASAAGYITTETDPVASAAGYLTTETDPVAGAAGYANASDVTANTAAIALNTAKVGITADQASAIAANTDSLVDLGNNVAFDGWDKSVVDDADFITTETDPVASAAGYLTSYTETDPVASAAGYLTTETDPVASAAGYLTSESDPVAAAAGYATQGWVEDKGYLTTYTETDPVAGAAGYATQTWVENKGYLTSYTETDPVATAAGYLTSESDPVAAAAGYATQSWVSSQGYLTSYTETDPVASAAGYLTAFTESDPVYTGDADNDGVSNADDNCPTIANSNQLDADRDNTGDACDAYNPAYVPSADGTLTFTRCPVGIDFLTSFVACRNWFEQAGDASTYAFEFCDVNDSSCESGGELDGSGNSGLWDACANLNLGGYSDWRVPTQAEMTVWYTDIRSESLIDTNGWYSSRLWTSESYSSNSGYSMDTSGNFSAEVKSTNNQVYCVRGAGN